MRYYDLNQDGTVKGNYAVDQPDKTLYLLNEAPSDTFYMRDGVPGENWIVNVAAVNAHDAIDLKKAQEHADILDAIPDWPTIKAFFDNLQVDIDAVTNVPLKSILTRLCMALRKDTRILNILTEPLVNK